MALELTADDLIREIVDYLRDPSKKVDRKIRFQAIKYVLLEEDLCYRTIDGVLLKCIDKDLCMIGRRFLANNAGGLFHILQRVSRMPEVW